MITLNYNVLNGLARITDHCTRSRPRAAHRRVWAVGAARGPHLLSSWVRQGRFRS